MLNVMKKCLKICFTQLEVQKYNRSKEKTYLCFIKRCDTINEITTINWTQVNGIKIIIIDHLDS